MTKKILITSALPYVNNVPHLGNIIGATLSADVFARFCRSKGLNTRFICGTDEHGTTTEVKALEEGLTPQEICDKYYVIHDEIYKWFNISFDHFGRTSSDVHKKITQDIFLKLYENGFIIEDFLDELYCNTCKKSLADRFVEGTCPRCGYEEARGDQCDKCSNLLNPFELINPKCKTCKSAPSKISTKHLFLDLPKLQPKIEEWVKKASTEGKWSENTITYTNAWLNEGLKKRCITRQLKWGIPVPLKEFENLVFYVWFDAPIGYISITAEKFDDYESWWQNPEHVKLYQFMGKDNVPFHSILFPGTEIATNKKYTMVHHISTTEFLNYEDAKFSKSRGTGVFGDDAVRSGLPSDAYRYYLLINRPEKSDTVFSWDDFSQKLNSELIANLGNLVNRTLVFLSKSFDSKIPEHTLNDGDQEFLNNAKIHHKKIEEYLHDVRLKEALKEVMTLCNIGNKYFQDNEPWKLVKEDNARAKTVMYVLCNFVKDVAILIEPFLPATSRSIFEQLNIEQKSWNDLGHLNLKEGHQIGKTKTLFSKLEDEKKEELKNQFGDKSKNEEKAEKIEGFAQLNLKVAKILDAKEHPTADKLMVLQVDLGHEKRQIVAGIRSYYSKEELIDKKIVVVTNLKPAKLRGEESNGMLLACGGAEGTTLGLLTVHKSNQGEQVFIDGVEPNKHQITIDAFATINLEGHSGHAFCDGKKLKTAHEEISVDRNAVGKIK